jgi:hypothetical protein
MAETIDWYFLLLVLLWQTLNDVLLGMVDASLKRYLQTHSNPAGNDLYSKISLCVCPKVVHVIFIHILF